jgi:hypothetical protein
MPAGMDRNLWDEFYGLHGRREAWRGYRAMLLNSPEEARLAARPLTQFVARNFVDAQALAVRRIADPGLDPRVVSFGRILSEVGERPDVLGDEFAAEARADLAALGSAAEDVTTFASKYVAHLDHDQATVPPVNLEDVDAVVDSIGKLWERWHVRVTGSLALSRPAGVPRWWEVLTLQPTRDPWARVEPTSGVL